MTFTRFFGALAEGLAEFLPSRVVSSETTKVGKMLAEDLGIVNSTEPQGHVEVLTTESCNLLRPLIKIFCLLVPCGYIILKIKKNF